MNRVLYLHYIRRLANENIAEIAEVNSQRRNRKINKQTNPKGEVMNLHGSEKSLVHTFLAGMKMHTVLAFCKTALPPGLYENKPLACTH